MLLIQSITLTWSPRERGGQAAAARARFPLACPVEERALVASPDGAVVQTLHFFQDGDTILTAEEECRQGLQAHLARQGFPPPRRRS